MTTIRAWKLAGTRSRRLGEHSGPTNPTLPSTDRKTCSIVQSLATPLPLDPQRTSFPKIKLSGTRYHHERMSKTAGPTREDQLDPRTRDCRNSPSRRRNRRRGREDLLDQSLLLEEQEGDQGGPALALRRVAPIMGRRRGSIRAREGRSHPLRFNKRRRWRTLDRMENKRRPMILISRTGWSLEGETRGIMISRRGWRWTLRAQRRRRWRRWSSRRSRRSPLRARNDGLPPKQTTTVVRPLPRPAPADIP